jgi:hypothetical protein
MKTRSGSAASAEIKQQASPSTIKNRMAVMVCSAPRIAWFCSVRQPPQAWNPIECRVEADQRFAVIAAESGNPVIVFTQ